VSAVLPWIVATIGAGCLAGLAFLVRLLRRGSGQLWRPGDGLPEAPADAPIRTWTRSHREPVTPPAASRP